MNDLSIVTEDSFASLFELAANNDIESFKKWIEREHSSIDDVGVWYIRIPGSKKLFLEQRTPLMVAATYGSIDVLKFIILSSRADINRSCGNTKSTALHCAASGGSDNAVEVVKLLLAAGADTNLADSNGQRPIDVIVVSPKFLDVKMALQQLLAVDGSDSEVNHARCITSFDVDHAVDPPSPQRNESPSPAFGSCSFRDTKLEENLGVSGLEKKEYPIDPNFPDIKNSIYGTDEFRIYSFKVRPCSRAYSHDWTECPFVHPGENARRRDPRKFHYSCVPCPEFRKGACRRSDMCEYAHGVFECWLHPAQYRTRICKDGIDCARRVCFFAHTPEELRPLYVSTGSAVPSPRSNYSSAMDFAAAMNMLPPGSPSSGLAMSPSPFTPPMSPNGSPSQLYWPPNIPSLNLPGSNLQSSRLRSSFNARDIPTDEFAMLGDPGAQQYQMLNDLTGLYATNSVERPGHLKTPMPLSLEDLFACDLSPRYADSPFASSVQSPTHKSAIFNQFQQQRQGMLSPINTNISANNLEHNLLQGSYGVSPRNMERLEPISPMNSRVTMLANREKLRSHSFRDPGTNAVAQGDSPSSSNWGFLSGKHDWAMSSEELDKLRRSSSFDMRNSKEEPDSIWACSPILDPAPEIRNRASFNPGLAISSSSEGFNSISSNVNSLDHPALGALLEQMQLDELMGSSK